MIELLISLIQAVCVAGYLYGAWLVFAHSATPDNPPQAPARRLDDAAEWQRHLACDV